MAATLPQNTSVSPRAIIVSAIEERVTDRELHAANLNRAVSLIGSNLAMFTFVLVFLFPRYVSDQLNGILFQMTLTSSLLAIFLLVISGISYFEAVAFTRLSAGRKMALIRRGDSLFVLGLMHATAMPVLILFTLPGLFVVAVSAAVLWALSAGFLLRQGQKLLHT